MEATERKIGSQIQFWALLGPFLVLLSIAILLFKVSDHWYIPFCALIGIPLCAKWHIKGMISTFILLSVVLFSTYQDLDLDERYWHIGLALAIAFSFIILTLSFEETEGLLQKLQFESQSRMDNFVKLDHKWKEAEVVWSEDKEALASQIKSLAGSLSKVEEEKQTFYKLAQLAKDELTTIRDQHEKLIQDLIYKKQQIAELHERVEETELTIQGFLSTDAEKQIELLKDSLSSAELTQEQLKLDNEALEANLRSLEQACQTSEEEKSCLAHELQYCQERELALTLQVEAQLQEKENYEKDVEQLKEQLNALECQCEQQLICEREQQSTLREDYEQQLARHQEISQCLKKTFEEQQAELEEKYRLLQTSSTEELAKQHERYFALQKSFEDQMVQLQSQVDDKKEQSQDSPFMHAIEAKYLQLRSQFQEKSDTLNATRREVFHLQEKLLKWEKDLEEDKLSGVPKSEGQLIRELMKLDKQFDLMKQRYEEEIDQLTDLISSLFTELNK